MEHGRTGQACAGLQTLDKWVGRRQVTICRQVISFANGLGKGSKNIERGGRQSQGHGKGFLLTLVGEWEI